MTALQNHEKREEREDARREAVCGHRGDGSYQDGGGAAIIFFDSLGNTFDVIVLFGRAMRAPVVIRSLSSVRPPSSFTALAYTGDQRQRSRDRCRTSSVQRW